VLFEGLRTEEIGSTKPSKSHPLYPFFWEIGLLEYQIVNMILVYAEPLQPGIFFSFGKKYRQAAENTVFINTGNTGRNTGKYRPKLVKRSFILVSNLSKFLNFKHIL
jgi:hypothetical protein